MNRVSTLLLACAAPVLLGGSTARAIVINNPGFETPASGNPDGWGVPVFSTLVDAVDVSGDVALEGAQSLKITALTLGQSTEPFNPVYSASGDGTVPITFALSTYKPSASAVTNQFLVLGIEFKKLNTPGDPGSGDTFVSGNETVFETNNLPLDTWTPLSVTFTAAGPWDVLLLHVKSIGLEPTASGVYYLDGVTATAAAVPEPSALAVPLALAGLTLRRRRI